MDMSLLIPIHFIPHAVPDEVACKFVRRMKYTHNLLNSPGKVSTNWVHYRILCTENVCVLFHSGERGRFDMVSCVYFIYKLSEGLCRWWVSRFKYCAPAAKRRCCEWFAPISLFFSAPDLTIALLFWANRQESLARFSEHIGTLIFLLQSSAYLSFHSLLRNFTTLIFC